METDPRKKNVFWILSGVAVFILLVAWLAGWWMITTSTEEQTNARDAVFSKVNNLSQAIPNDKVSKELQDKQAALTDNVYAIWTERYDKMIEHFSKTLSDKTKDATRILTEEATELRTQEMDVYYAVLTEEMKSLYKKIDLRIPKDADIDKTVDEARGNRPGEGASGGGSTPSVGNMGSGGGSNQAAGVNDDEGSGASLPSGQAGGRGGRGQQPGGRGGRGGAPNRPASGQQQQAAIEYKGLVDWQDREMVVERYLSWNSPPKPAQVKYAVEYWAAMYSVIDVIAQTNAGTQSHYDAPIKQIRQLRIGRLGPQSEIVKSTGGEGDSSSNDSGNGDLPQMGSVGSGGGGGQSQAAGVSDGENTGGGGASSSSAPSGGSSAPNSVVDPAWGTMGFKLPAAAPQPSDEAALENGRYVDDNGAPVKKASDNPHAEFRMIPLYMEVVIDQQKIQEFFDRAAASPLPIEIKQICAVVNIPASEKANPGIVEYGPNDVLLKVRGVIFFYQKPDKAKIGKKPSELAAANPQ